MKLVTSATMNHILRVLLIATALGAVDGVSKRSKKTSGTKIPVNDVEERHRTLSSKFLTQNVVSLTDSNHSKYINSRPRDYTAVVMYTALSKNHQCDVCRSLQPLFNDVAAFYNAQYNFNTSVPKERLAFFIVDADSAGRTFDEMRLETVPKFYVYPNKTLSTPKLKQEFLEMSNR